MTYNIKLYNINTVNTVSIDFPDIYFTPEYGKACEYSDNAIWELCVYKDLIFCYLKKIKENQIITPYGYSGFYYKNQNTLIEFIPHFQNYLKSINITTNIIRQSPYLNININKQYKLLKEKTLLCIKVKTEDEYFNKILNSKTRNIINKSKKIGLKVIFYEKNKLVKINNFINMYNQSMKQINSDKYYYFNDEYFKTIFNLDKCILTVITNNEDIDIGYGLFFIYKNYLHYHLSCNDKSNNCIHNYMIYQTLIKYGLNKIFILGGGLKDNDNLFKFKKKISNIEFKYRIFTI